MRKNITRALIEIASVLFLFYSNLLMGEFTRSGRGQGKSLLWALRDIFTVKNFIIGIVAAFVGYIIFEFLRSRYFTKYSP
jgi:hypothetical protein